MTTRNREVRLLALGGVPLIRAGDDLSENHPERADNRPASNCARAMYW
jgi:hypothetical protein